MAAVGAHVTGSNHGPAQAMKLRYRSAVSRA
jgi:hypothetical protein